MIYSLKYTENIKKGFAGYARLWFIRIRPIYKNDKGLLEHEKTHVKQFWHTFGFHGILYLLPKSYKLDAEIEAYKVQLEYVSLEMKDITRIKFANRIATMYNLNISEKEAHQLLL